MSTKKIITILVSILLILTTSLTAYATQGSNTNSGTGSITITNAESGRVYDIYRIFDLTGSIVGSGSTFTNYAYTINEETNGSWVNFFIGSGAPGASYLIEKTAGNTATYEATLNQLTYNGTAYFINITSSNVDTFAAAALEYAVNLTNNDGSATASSANVLFDDIELGYYLVFPQGATDITTGNASICSLTTTNPTQNVTRKADYPTITKTVNDASVDVGQVVTYTVTGKVPDTTGYTSYIYKVSDNMSSGLTFNSNLSDISVKFGSQTITVPDGTKATGAVRDTDHSNGFYLQFDMTKYQAYKGETITITYKAVVNDAAVATVTNNSAVLTYSNDPDNPANTVSNPAQEVEVYTSKIIIDKYDINDSTKKLSGAKFVLVKKNGGNETFYKYTAAVGTTPAKVEWVNSINNATEVTTDENNPLAAVFSGLEDGTYYLRETAHPDGYNLLKDDVEVTLTHTVDSTTNKNVGVVVTQGVGNKSGSILPSTGGIGTVIFYVVGISMILCAVVILIKRNVNAKKAN